MTVTLRRVLEAFEEAGGVIRHDALSRELNLDPGTLDSMIQHWIRKGRIREVRDGLPDGCDCRACGIKGACPFVIHLPRRYELVPPAEPAPLATP
jgi:hypothetical protein